MSKERTDWKNMNETEILSCFFLHFNVNDHRCIALSNLLMAGALNYQDFIAFARERLEYWEELRIEREKR